MNNDTIKANKGVMTHQVRFDPEEHPALAKFAEFMNEGSFEICMNRVVHGMEESDWIILRFCAACTYSEMSVGMSITFERAWEYLIERYGAELVYECCELIDKEIT